MKNLKKYIKQQITEIQNTFSYKANDHWALAQIETLEDILQWIKDNDK